MAKTIKILSSTTPAGLETAVNDELAITTQCVCAMKFTTGVSSGTTVNLAVLEIETITEI